MPDIEELRLKFRDGREIVIAGAYVREYSMSMGYDRIDVEIRLIVPRYAWRSEPDYPPAPEELAPPPLQIERPEE